jgi:cytochrome c
MGHRLKSNIIGSLKSSWMLIAAALAASTGYADCDRVRGAEAFTKCSACHSLQPGQHLMGPSLAKLRERKAGTVEGFAFSPALRTSDMIWNEETLSRFIEDPQNTVRGTAMPFRGIKDANERAALVCYLLEQP